MHTTTHVITISQTTRIVVAAKDPVVLPAVKRQSCCLWFGRKISEAVPQCLAASIMRCFSPCCSIEESIALEQAISAKWNEIPEPVKNIIYSYANIESLIVECIKTLFESYFLVPHKTLHLHPQKIALLHSFQDSITSLDFSRINLNSSTHKEEVHLWPCGKIQKIVELFPGLKRLKLSRCRIGYLYAVDCSDACIQAIVKGCQKLEHLDLSHNQIADSSLHLLSNLRHLKTLNLTDCFYVTAKTKRELVKLHSERQTAVLDDQRELLKDQKSALQNQPVKEKQLPFSPTVLTIFDEKNPLKEPDDLLVDFQALSLQSAIAPPTEQAPQDLRPKINRHEVKGLDEE
jgi:hypothetical protein